MKKFGFLTFGHWHDAKGSQTLSAKDSYKQTAELAERAEAIGVDGAFVRVHHYAKQISDPVGLLGYMAGRTSKIELGTAVIDMRYTNPLGLAEGLSSVDLLSDGRLQIGLSRGSPEPALNGPESFGYSEGEGWPNVAREKTELFLKAIDGERLVKSNPEMTGHSGGLALTPVSVGMRERTWWGSGTRGSAKWVGQMGLNLMSSTLLTEVSEDSFDKMQEEQLEVYLEEFYKAGHQRAPRMSVSRSIFPLVEQEDFEYFGRGGLEDRVGFLDGGLAKFGKVYVGVPDKLVRDLKNDVAIKKADTLLVTIPNMLGVEYNTRLLKNLKAVLDEIRE